MESFDKNIREKLQGLDIAPPADLWPSIEQRLEKTPSGKRFVWYRVAAAIAILMVALYSGLFLVPDRFNTGDNLLVSDKTESTGSFLTETDTGTSEQIADKINNVPESHDISIHAGSGLSAVYDRMGGELFDGSYPGHVETKFAQQKRPAGFEKFLPVLRASLPIYPVQLLAGQRVENPDAGYDVIEFKAKPERQPTLAFAANGNDKVTGFSLSAFFSPQESYRYQAKSSYIPYETVESQLRSLGFGINLHYRLNSKFEIQSGITFSRWGQQVHDIAVYSHPSKSPLYTIRGEPTTRHPQSMITSMGGIRFINQSYYYADVSSSRVLTIRGTFDDSNVRILGKTATGLIQQFDFMEIPFVLRYRFIDRGFFVAAKAGVSAQILTSANVYLNEPDGNNSLVGDIVDVYTYNLAGTGGLVFGFPMSNKINLLVEPTASMFINSLGVNNNLAGKTYPYSYSVFIGLSYDF